MLPSWRGGRVAEGSRLEIVRPDYIGTVGSNPTLSAIETNTKTPTSEVGGLQIGGFSGELIYKLGI